MDSEKKIEEILKVIGFAKYSTADRTSRLGDLSKLIIFYGQRRGTEISAESALTQATMLDDDVFNYYGDRLSFAEVKLALDWGTRGEYGDNTGINADRLFKHVRAYAEREERVEAVRRNSQNRALPAHPTDFFHRYVDFWNTVFTEVRNLWNDFTKGNFTECSCNDVFRRHTLYSCYSWLRAVGLVADTEETRKAERDAMKKSLKTFGDDRAYTANLYAGALMLQSYFQVAKDTGFDLDAQLDALQSTTDDAKFSLKWYDLKEQRFGGQI